MAEAYGIFDIKRVPVRLLATLAVGLREDSRVKRAKTGTKYDDNTILLACITDLLKWIQWSKTKDGADGVNYPGTPMLDYFLDRSEPQTEEKQDHLVFDSPESFQSRWKEITRT